MTSNLLRRIVVLAACAAVAAGCSGTLEPKKIDYKSAGKLPPLDVPPDLTQPSTDERFAVPDISPSGTATYSAYAKDRGGQAPQGGGIAPTSLKEGARIERSGTQRWLVVAATPEQAWPVVKEFWQENGFIVNVEKPETGVMETDWAENRAKIPQDFIRSFLSKVIDQAYSTAERDKFRTRLERTADGMSTEIFISHRGMYEVLEGVDTATSSAQRTVWQPRPADPDLEAEMLARLMTRFGVQEERARAMLTTAGGAERAKLLKQPSGGSTLVVNEPFDRAWRRVGLALDRVGFTVEDRDRANGTYFVRYVDPGKQETQLNKGILDKLFSWTGDSSKSKPEQYRIEVRENADTTQVTVLSAAGAPDKSDASNRILTLLYDQLK